MLATKTFDGNTYIKNESHKSYLGNEEKKQCFQMFLDRTRTLVLYTRLHATKFARPKNCAVCN